MQWQTHFKGSASVLILLGLCVDQINVEHNDFTDHKQLASGLLILYKSLERKHPQNIPPCPA